jgi:hypothetical protein
MNETAIVKVSFEGKDLDLIRMPDGSGGVVFRRLCETVGADPDGQLNRLARVRETGARWASTSIMEVQMPGDDQRRKVVVLPIRSIPMWAATLDASRLADDARALVVAYQDTAAEVLARVFIDKEPALAGHSTMGVPGVLPALRAALREAARLRDNIVSTAMGGGPVAEIAVTTKALHAFDDAVLSPLEEEAKRRLASYQNGALFDRI